MITQLTELEYRQFQKEYNDYLDGIAPDEYKGTNTQLQALQEVINNAPSRESNTTENQGMDAQTTNTTYTKQRIHCVVEETVQVNL